MTPTPWHCVTHATWNAADCPECDAESVVPVEDCSPMTTRTLVTLTTVLFVVLVVGLPVATAVL